MRRHAIFESLEIEGELLRIELARLKLLDEHVVVVYALAAAIYLQATEEQVEA